MRVIAAGRDEPTFLAKGGERVVDVKLAAVAGPQGAEAGGRAGDVHVVLVVRWRVRVGLRRGLLLLLQVVGGVVLGCVVRRPRPLRNPCWRMHPVLWMVKKEKRELLTLPVKSLE